MSFILKNKVVRHKDDRTGRFILSFIPIMRATVCASGELSFAIWQVWEDEPHTFRDAYNSALDNASKVLSAINPEITRFREDATEAQVVGCIAKEIHGS